MKRVLFDTNVILDVLLERHPHAKASAAAWAAAESGKVKGMLAAHAVTTIHYLVGKQLGDREARRVVEAVLSVFAVATVNSAVLKQALQSPQTDFEDAVTAAAAQAESCDWILSRDPKGFRGSPVRSLLPEALLSYSVGR